MSEARLSEDGPLNIGQVKDPNAALGAAVAYLMRAPAFARQPFGPWSRVLAGQVNRRHYAIARRGGHTVGFVGFGLCEHTVVDRFLHEGTAPSSAECESGRCLLINAWMADDKSVSLAIRRWLLTHVGPVEYVFARRVHDDGTARPISMRVVAR